jgi:hypothetical protein
VKNVIITLGLLLSSITSVQAQDVVSQLQACRAQTDNAVRLACYDKLAVKYAEKNIKNDLHVTKVDKPNSKTLTPAAIAPAKSPATPPVSVSTEKRAPTNDYVSHEDQVKRFGLSKVIEPEEKVEKITSVITSVQKTPYGKLIITLETGQVWRQTNSTSLRLKPGQEVYVEEGALGSYFLGKESSNKRIRVKRSK